MAPLKWREVVCGSEFTIKGGWQQKSWTVETKSVQAKDDVLLFVKVEKKSEWLTKLVAGPNANKSVLTRTKLIQELKQMTIDNKGAQDAAVADSAISRHAKGEIESYIDEVRDTEFESPVKKSRRYQPKRNVDSVMIVEMPVMERTLHPGRVDRRNIRLLPISTNSLWIETGAIGWMVQWLVDELASGGVTVLEEEARSKPQVANCEAPGVIITWELKGSRWIVVEAKT